MPESLMLFCLSRWSSFLSVQLSGDLHLLSAGKEMMSVTACSSWSILTERTVAHIVCPGVQVSSWTLFLYVLEFIYVCVNMGTCIPAYMCADQRTTFGNQISLYILGSGDQIQAFRLALQGAVLSTSPALRILVSLTKILGYFSKFILFVFRFCVCVCVLCNRWLFWLKELKSQFRLLGVLSSIY